MIESLGIRVALAILTCYRLAEFISVDDGPFKIFGTLRHKIGILSTKSRFHHELALLINCPFCIGVWISGLVSLTVFFPSNFGDVVLIVGAISGGQAFLESCSGRFLEK